MKFAKLDLELFNIWFVFNYKWNNNLVVRSKRDWVYLLNLEHDPEFSGDKNEIYYETFECIELSLLDWPEVDLSLFTNNYEWVENSLNYFDEINLKDLFIK